MTFDSNYHTVPVRYPEDGSEVDWMESAPKDEPDRHEFLMRLIELLAHEVSREIMEEAVAKALPGHGVKRQAAPDL